MRIKVLLSILTAVLISIFGVVAWYYVYLPNKELSELQPFKDKLVKDIYISNAYSQNDAEEINNLLKIKAAANAVKRDIITHSVGLRSEKAKKASSALLSTAEYTERWCMDSWVVGRGMLGDQKISDKEFEKHLDSLYKTQNKLENELIPLLEGYFKE